ncbi:hypothetical protein FB451DRAFT_1191321 [Mycena latifolia]|nr:hypothetical protein FB451DRAFT_1191321 [Mycena latifolia]
MAHIQMQFQDISTTVTNASRGTPTRRSSRTALPVSASSCAAAGFSSRVAAEVKVTVAEGDSAEGGEEVGVTEREGAETRRFRTYATHGPQLRAGGRTQMEGKVESRGKCRSKEGRRKGGGEETMRKGKDRRFIAGADERGRRRKAGASSAGRIEGRAGAPYAPRHQTSAIHHSTARRGYRSPRPAERRPSTEREAQGPRHRGALRRGARVATHVRDKSKRAPMVVDILSMRTTPASAPRRLPLASIDTDHAHLYLCISSTRTKPQNPAHEAKRGRGR